MVHIKFYIDFRIVIGGKSLGQQVHESVHPAVSQGTVAPLKLDISGCLGDAHDGVFREGKIVQIFLFIVFGEDDFAAQGLLPVAIGIHNTFRGRLRHSSRHQFQAVDSFQQGVGLEYAFVALPVYIEDIRLHRALYRPHMFLLLQSLHVLFLEAQGGQQPVVKQLVLQQIIMGRLHHDGFGDFQSRKEAHAQCHDGEDGQVTSQALPDFPQCGFFHHGFHLITPFLLQHGRATTRFPRL